MVPEVRQKTDPRTTEMVIRLVMNSHLPGMIGNLDINVHNHNQDQNRIGTIAILIVNILIATTEKEIGVKSALEGINVIMDNLVIAIIVIIVPEMITTIAMTTIAITTIDMETIVITTIDLTITAIKIILSGRKSATKHANFVNIVAVTRH